MKKIILAVDDAPSILGIIESIFKSKYQVILKQNGKDALDWLQEGNFPDIIITDLKMPEIDGWQFLHHLKSSGYFKNIPVLVLSGNEKSDDRIQILQNGAEDVLVKPFNPIELLLRVENILKRIEEINIK